MKVDEITIKSEFIKLGQFLKFTGIISSGYEAKTFLLDNDVFVNEKLERRRGKKLFNEDVVKVGIKTYKIIRKV